MSVNAGVSDMNRAERRALKAAQAARSARAHELRVMRVYGLPEGGYAALYAAQGGRCAICQWATGRTKRLAVDHDHQTGEVRGLLCGPCNQTIGRLRDAAEAFDRAAEYLRNPPARRVLAELGEVAA